MPVLSLKTYFILLFCSFRTAYTDWQKTYETLAEMVVPRSSKWVLSSYQISSQMTWAIFRISIWVFMNLSQMILIYQVALPVSLQQYDKYLPFLPVCYSKIMTVACLVSLYLGKPLTTSNTKPERTSKNCYTYFTSHNIVQITHKMCEK